MLRMYQSRKLDEIVSTLLLLECGESTLLNEMFHYNSLTPEEKDTLYQAFRDAYEKAVGVAWDRNKFENRAYGWTFFGDVEGGIAVRQQRSGMYKLNATFGELRKILKAYYEMDSKIGNEPVWGVMTADLAKMLEKLSKGKFKQPPKMFTKMVIPHIKGIFGADIKKVEGDGAIVVDTPAGLMKKYFIGNKAYFDTLLDNALAHPERVPVPQPVLKMLIPIIKSMF